jgi:hypothetical protein
MPASSTAVWKRLVRGMLLLDEIESHDDVADYDIVEVSQIDALVNPQAPQSGDLFVNAACFAAPSR